MIEAIGRALRYAAPAIAAVGLAACDQGTPVPPHRINDADLAAGLCSLDGQRVDFEGNVVSYVVDSRYLPMPVTVFEYKPTIKTRYVNGRTVTTTEMDYVPTVKIQLSEVETADYGIDTNGDGQEDFEALDTSGPHIIPSQYVYIVPASASRETGNVSGVGTVKQYRNGDGCYVDLAAINESVSPTETSGN